MSFHLPRQGYVLGEEDCMEAQETKVEDFVTVVVTLSPPLCRHVWNRHCYHMLGLCPSADTKQTVAMKLHGPMQRICPSLLALEYTTSGPKSTADSGYLHCLDTHYFRLIED